MSLASRRNAVPGASLWLLNFALLFTVYHARIHVPFSYVRTSHFGAGNFTSSPLRVNLSKLWGGPTKRLATLWSFDRTQRRSPIF